MSNEPRITAHAFQTSSFTGTYCGTCGEGQTRPDHDLFGVAETGGPSIRDAVKDVLENEQSALGDLGFTDAELLLAAWQNQTAEDLDPDDDYYRAYVTWFKVCNTVYARLGDAGVEAAAETAATLARLS